MLRLLPSFNMFAAGLCTANLVLDGLSGQWGKFAVDAVLVVFNLYYGLKDA